MNVQKVFSASLLVFSLSIVGSGCASMSGATPPIGVFYSSVKGAPSNTQIEASDGVRPGPKSGRACAMGVMGVAAWGDMSLDAAKKQGGISRVDTMDVKVFSVFLDAYVEKCLEITGE